MRNDNFQQIQESKIYIQQKKLIGLCLHMKLFPIHKFVHHQQMLLTISNLNNLKVIVENIKDKKETI